MPSPALSTASIPLITSVSEMQARAEAARQQGQRLALVPTMGALHDGHLELVEAARQSADHVTVSIFVNPTQFGPNEDFEQYPRTLAEDLQRLEARGGVSAVFAPSPETMYPYGLDRVRTWVTVEELGRHLCGRYREGHFLGVTTVVTKLFLCCKPHLAFFGRKDAQQYLILRRMARELHFDVEVVGVPTVREGDGLAMSSRNRYLTPEERAQAVVLSQAVAAARARVEAGEQRGSALVEAMRQTLRQAPLATVEYAAVVDTETLQPVTQVEPGQEVLCAVAVFFGRTRLIDNAFVTAPA